MLLNQLVKKIVDIISHTKNFDNFVFCYYGVVFISFDLQSLIDMRALLPEQPIQYLVSTYSPEVRETLNKYNLDLDIHFKGLTEEALAEVHADGHVVNFWTVDDPADGERLAAWGVDMITSNILE